MRSTLVLSLSRLTRKFTAAFVADRRGGIGITAGLAVPFMLLLVGGVVDQTRYFSKKNRLQDATDAAALSAAKELSLSDAKRDNMESVAKAIVSAKTKSGGGAAAAAVDVNVTDEPLMVEVKARQAFAPVFGDVFGFNVPEVKARSVARVVGQPNICVLALDPSETGAISLEKQARVTGKNCAVYSNSGHTNAVKSVQSASLTAEFICSRGGKEGGPGNFSPEPMTDCPGFDDPLAGRPEPVPGPCVTKPIMIPGLIAALLPGTYCGGLTLKAGTQAVLTPGVYIIKDGPLVVENGSSLTGVGVGFYFTGPNATFTFNDKTLISLTAPLLGDMAGLLMFESRSQPPTGVHKLMSNNAPLLLGTIYLSRGELHIDAQSPIALDSAYTAIVARTMRLYGGPHLVLNTNYSKSDVPVPLGIRGVGQPVVLAE